VPSSIARAAKRLGSDALLGILTLTPYDYWRRKARRSSRDIGAISIAAASGGRRHADRTREYRARGRDGVGCATAVYRHPIVMFGVGPAYLFILGAPAFRSDLMRSGWQPWLSTMATNVAIAALVATMIWLVGVGPFLLVHLPTMVAPAASVGGLAVLRPAPVREYRMGS